MSDQRKNSYLDSRRIAISHVRIRCACEDTSIQDYVAALMKQNMVDYIPQIRLPPKAISGVGAQGIKARQSGGYVAE